MMTFLTAVVLVFVSLPVEAAAGTLFGCLPSLPLYVLFYFSTGRRLPWTLLGAILAGMALDVLCGRSDPWLLRDWPAALLLGTLVRSRLAEGGRWTALPAGAAMQFLLVLLQWPRGISLTDGAAHLLFSVTAGGGINLLVTLLLDHLAQRLNTARYAVSGGYRINRPVRKHRSTASGASGDRT